MSISSQPEDYSITLNDPMSVSSADTITLTSTLGSTITIDPSYSYSSINSVGAAGSIYTISGLNTSQINTISSISISDFKINLPKDWVDCFPDFNRVDKMCKKYPGLDIALRNFKTVYELVKDDYDNPTPKK